MTHSQARRIGDNENSLKWSDNVLQVQFNGETMCRSHESIGRLFSFAVISDDCETPHPLQLNTFGIVIR